MILQMFVTLTTLALRPEVEVDTEIPVKDPANDVTKAQYYPVSIWGFEQEKWCTDLQATFKNMTIYGDFYNGITNARKPMMMPNMPKPNADESGDPSSVGNKPVGNPPMGRPPVQRKSYPINLVLTLDNVKLEGVISASRAQHAVKNLRF